MSKHNPITVMVVTIEVLLLFVVGILGNKIAERLDIPSWILISVTMISLIILSVISYIRTHNPSNQSSSLVSNSPRGLSIKRFIPKTAISIFPFGILMGFLIGTITALFGNDSYAGTAPQWMCSLVDLCEYSLIMSELTAIIIGCVIFILFSITVDGILAGSLSIGYGLSLPAAILAQANFFASTYATYVGHIAFFTALGIILMITEPLLRFVRKVFSQPRL
jgi:hypothetical protein